MAHAELLPDRHSVIADLTAAGLSDGQVREALRSFGHLLRMHSDYFSDRYEIDGMKEDAGARDALDDLADGLDY